MAEAQITTLFVIRHGETAWNVDGRLQGQLDIPLNDRGREQAAAAGEYIRAKYSAAGQPLHAVYSSDLSRARETAEAIASACDLKVALDSRLRETNLGVWQSMLWDDVARERSDEMRAWKSNVDYAMPQGECLRKRFHRVACCLHDIVATHPGQRVAVVAHGGIIDEVGRLAMKVAFGKPTMLRKMNCGINILQFVHGAKSALDSNSNNSADGSTDAASPAPPSSPSASQLPHVCPFRPSPTAHLFPHASVDPVTAADVLGGAWSIVQWGVTEHLDRIVAGDGRPVLAGRMDGPGAHSDHAHSSSSGGSKSDGTVADGGASAGAGAGAEADVVPRTPAGGPGPEAPGHDHHNDEEDAVSGGGV